MTDANQNEQDYIPGTRVIRNLIDRGPTRPYGTTDQHYLAQAETLLVSERLDELHQKPITDVKLFSFAHMRRIHQHLFQDVYAWAGEPRRVPMTKLDTAYAQPAEMNALLREQYTALAARDHLQGITSREEFTQQLAGFWAEINHAHAFREGNTRSQTVFFEQLARGAGWSLDVSRLSPHHPSSVYQPFVDARFEHQRIRDASGIKAVRNSAGVSTSTTPQPSAAALSGPLAAQQLANVLNGLIEPDPSPEGYQRRGEAKSPVTERHAPVPGASEARARLHAQYPELRTMELDPYGIVDETKDKNPSGAGVDYQL